MLMKTLKELLSENVADDVKEPSSLEECTEFDKFLDAIVEGEAKKLTRETKAAPDAPSRVYQKRYMEYPNNRIVYGRSR